MKKFKNLYEAFIEFLDSLYYDGYTEQIRTEKPDLFDWEWQQFQECFS